MRITALEINGVQNPNSVPGGPILLSIKYEGVEGPFLEARVSSKSDGLLTNDFGSDVLLFKPARFNFPVLTIDGDKLERNKKYYIHARVGLHGEWSEWAWGWFRMNSLPVAKDLKVLCGSYKDGIEASYSFEDEQGDSEKPPLIRWFMNGKEEPSLQGRKKIERVSPGQAWQFSIRPYDGIEFGQEQRSKEMVVRNDPPVLRRLCLVPKNPVEREEIRVSWAATDPEGEDTSCKSSWLCNGQRRLELDDRQTVPSGMVKAGDVWSCELSAFDGYDYSQPMRCESGKVRTFRSSVQRILVDGVEGHKSVSDKNPLFSWEFDGKQTSYRLIIGTRPLSIGSDNTVKTGSEIHDSGAVESSSNFWKYEYLPPDDHDVSPEECQPLGMSRVGRVYTLVGDGAWMRIRPACPKAYYEMSFQVENFKQSACVVLSLNGSEKASATIKGNSRFACIMIAGPSDIIEIKTNAPKGTKIGPITMKSIGTGLPSLKDGVAYFVSLSCCDGMTWSNWKTTSFKTDGRAWDGASASTGWTVEFEAEIASKDERFRLSMTAADGDNEVMVGVFPNKVVLYGSTDSIGELNCRQKHVYRVCLKESVAILYVDNRRFIESKAKKSKSQKKLSICAEGANRWGASYKAYPGRARISFLRYSISGSFDPQVPGSLLLSEQGKARDSYVSSMAVGNEKLYSAFNKDDESFIASYSPADDSIAILEPVGGSGLVKVVFDEKKDEVGDPLRWMVSRSKVRLMKGLKPCPSIRLGPDDLSSWKAEGDVQNLSSSGSHLVLREGRVSFLAPELGDSWTSLVSMKQGDARIGRTGGNQQVSSPGAAKLVCGRNDKTFVFDESKKWEKTSEVAELGRLEVVLVGPCEIEEAWVFKGGCHAPESEVFSFDLPGKSVSGAYFDKGHILVGTDVGILKISQSGDVSCEVPGCCSSIDDMLAVVDGNLHDLSTGQVIEGVGDGIPFRMGDSIALSNDQITIYSPDGTRKNIGESQGLPKGKILSSFYRDGVLAVGTERGCYVFWSDQSVPSLFGSGCVTAVSIDVLFVRIYEEGTERRIGLSSKKECHSSPIPSMARSATVQGDRTWVSTEAGLVLSDKDGIFLSSPERGFCQGRFDASPLSGKPLFEVSGTEWSMEDGYMVTFAPAAFAKAFVRGGWSKEAKFQGSKISSLCVDEDGLWFCLRGKENGLFRFSEPSEDGIKVRVDRLAPKGKAVWYGDGIEVQASDPVSGVRSVEVSEDEAFASPVVSNYSDKMRIPIRRSEYVSVANAKPDGPRFNRVVQRGSDILVGTRMPACLLSVGKDSVREIGNLDGYAVTDMIDVDGSTYVSVADPGKLFVFGSELEEISLPKKVSAVNCMATVGESLYLGCSPAMIFSVSSGKAKLAWEGSGRVTAICDFFGKLAWAVDSDKVSGSVLTTESKNHKHYVSTSSPTLSMATGHTDSKAGHMHDVINGKISASEGHTHYLIPQNPSTIMTLNPTTGRILEVSKVSGMVWGFSKVVTITKVAKQIEEPPEPVAPKTILLLKKKKQENKPTPKLRAVIEDVESKTLLVLAGPEEKIIGLDEEMKEVRFHTGTPCPMGRTRSEYPLVASAGNRMLKMDGSWNAVESFDEDIADFTDGLVVLESKIVRKAAPGEKRLFVRFQDGAGNKSAPEEVSMPSALSRDVPRQTGTHRIIQVTVDSAGVGITNTSITTDTNTLFSGTYIDNEIGYYYSPVFNGTSSLVQWYSIAWVATVPASHLITFSVRSATTESGIESATWGSEMSGSPGDLTNQTGQFLQFRATLSTTLATVSGTFGLSSVTITMRTAQATHYFTKNFDLPYNFQRGILTYNGTTNPPSTDVLFGVTGLDSTEFVDYYTIEPNKLFEVPDQHKTKDLRIGIKLISNETSVPIIDEFGLLFSMENNGWIQLNAGTTPLPSGGDVSTGTTKSVVSEVVEGHSHILVVPLTMTDITLYSGTTSTNAGHLHTVASGVLSTTMGHSHNWSL